MAFSKGQLIASVVGQGGVERMRRTVQLLGRRVHPELHPRRWSNVQLRDVAPHLRGHVANVSGWKDADREGGCYRDYFVNADRYSITNHTGARGLSESAEGAVALDLEQPLPEHLRGAFDVCFCHTVLEHVYEAQTAMENIAAMSRDLVVLVVPFLQDEHYEGGSYGDYWRYTPLGLRRMFADQGMEVLRLTSNDNVWYPIYLFAVASRRPEAWRHLQLPVDGTHRAGKQMLSWSDTAW